MRKIVTSLAFLALLIPGIGRAEGLGIAFVDAPEMGSGTCTGRDATEAFARARKQCQDQGGTAAECRDVAYCEPAGWSVDLFKQNREGFHWHAVHCGLASREDALALSRTLCDTKAHPDFAECAAVRLLDENGLPRDIPAE